MVVSPSPTPFITPTLSVSTLAILSSPLEKVSKWDTSTVMQVSAEHVGLLLMLAVALIRVS